uniref:VP1 n=1 Tax=Luscinia cyane Chaphamaparvovirus TaxID=2794491 RepID=A0A8A4XDF3_9VIRU|nr:MAG: VP1 [Luscinia cyane Chaphamaparvovirus]
MSDYTIDTLRSIYFTNQPYRYPNPWYKKQRASEGNAPGSFGPAINTGWHIIPNMLWGHMCSPRQWWEMMIKFEAITVTGITCRIFNPIPIQTALSFQGTNTFPAFNNTVYALGYTDDLYETPWFDWHGYPYNGTDQIYIFYEYNPAYKEGLIPKRRTDKYTNPGDCAESQEQLFSQEHKFPSHYYTQLTPNNPGALQSADDKYRRIFLPIYWYHNPYCQYAKRSSVTQNWRQLMSQWEEAWLDPSGAFWDPLNRPKELKELRPGKNMIEYGWSVHPSDEGIWFNTDRVAFPTPYPRPRPLQIPSGAWNKTSIQRPVDPIGPNVTVIKHKDLVNRGLLNYGEQATTTGDMMCPEQHMGNPSWRDFPVVPTRWFLKEMQQSNQHTYMNIKKYYYRGPVSGCPDPSPSHASGLKMGDAQIIGPQEDIKFPGTEYEMYKYPPTQWFLKAIPLYDDKENHIPVEMQAFMHITVTVKGKERRSSIYAPTWGPIPPMDLYSVNMDTNFGENYMRGRSGGARRTWMDPKDTRPTRSVDPMDISLYPRDGKADAQIVYPYHAQTQCIIDPNADNVELEQVPSRAKYAIKDNMREVSVQFETGSGERKVHIQQGDRCIM